MKKKFVEWMEDEMVGFKKVLLFIIKGLLVYVNYLLVFLSAVSLVLHILGIEVSDFYGYRSSGIPILKWNIILILVILIITEELIFRLIPLWLVVKFCRNSADKIIFIMLLSSIIFGFAHGQIINIFIQGVIGFLLSIIFLKCGGFQRKYLKATTSCVITHMIFNAFCITGFFLLKTAL